MRLIYFFFSQCLVCVSQSTLFRGLVLFALNNIHWLNIDICLASLVELSNCANHSCLQRVQWIHLIWNVPRVVFLSRELTKHQSPNIYIEMNHHSRNNYIHILFNCLLNIILNHFFRTSENEKSNLI